MTFKKSTSAVYLRNTISGGRHNSRPISTYLTKSTVGDITAYKNVSSIMKDV